MENLIILIATSLVMRLSTSRNFKNHIIGSTGCSTLLPVQDNEPFDVTRTVSGDLLYFHECSHKKVTYGIICIQLEQSSCLEEATEMLESYLNRLRVPFSIPYNTGVHEGSDWNNEASVCRVDYWQDEEGLDWKVKGYTDGNILSVLYVRNIGHVPVKRQDHFLDGFHFHATA